MLGLSVRSLSSLTKRVSAMHTIRHTFRYSSTNANVEQRFRSALENLKKLKEEPDNDVKLKLYALYKQSTVGECNTPKPGMLNIVEKAKWEAWTKLGNLSTVEAMQHYIDIVDKALAQSGVNTSPNGSDGGSADAKDADIIYNNIDGVAWIKFNRPKKFNAITSSMYESIATALQNAADDQNVKFAVMTGVGDYYSSGNDLSNFQTMAKEYSKDLRAGAEVAAKILQKFVASFIDFPKPLIGAVNGPAIGIAVTTLGLMDCVIASDSATFYSPFSALGQSPEACATYTFPLIMGFSRASEMLYFNYKMSAQEAQACGLISRVIPHNQFEAHLQEWLYGNKGLVKTCFPKSMMFSKGLVRNEEMRMKLHQINKEECETITDRWISDECAQALQQFFTRKQSNL